MSAQDEYVKENLSILQAMQLEGMSREDQEDWLERIGGVIVSYDEARATEKDASLTATERKEAKDRADAVAKAAPAIAKSVISAVSSFKKGDAINGSADILDICASVASMIGSFTTAAGPAGPLIGALLSVVSQILRIFGPKQESDVEKLEKFMKELQAQTKVTDLKAVHDSVLAYADTLMQQAESLRKMLARPLRNHNDYLAFLVELDKAAIILDAKDPHTDGAMLQNWAAVEYLRAPENQDVPLWPAVLGVCCKAYSDMLTSTMTIITMANTDDMLARLRDCAPDSTSTLSAEDRRTLEKKLVRIIAYSEARKVEYASCNRLMLSKLKGLVGVAQRWGLYAHIGIRNSLYIASGPRRVKDGDWKDLSDRNYYHRLTFFVGSDAAIDGSQSSPDFNFTPSYHCLVLKSNSSTYDRQPTWVDHLWVSADKLSVTNYRNVLANFTPAPVDVDVAGEDAQGLHIYGGTAEGTGAPGSITAWHIDRKDNYTTAPMVRDNWWPQIKGAVTAVCAVHAPVSPADDPDGADIQTGWSGEILYASMRDSSEVYVNEGNQGHYISGPANCGSAVGIATDQNYLWYFYASGFAVTSHASVMKSKRSGGQTGPRWMNYSALPADLHGLVSLSPCQDGTLLVAASPAGKEKSIQTGTYAVDIAAGTVKVGDWTKISGEARQVHKLPMPGWSLLGSLMAKLS